MNNIETNAYQPDYTIHPGEILEETLAARGIKKTALAERCGITLKTVSQIINGKALISPSIAIRLERAIGVSASLWSNLNIDYEFPKSSRETWEVGDTFYIEDDGKKLKGEIISISCYGYKVLWSNGEETIEDKISPSSGLI